jgi:hypothetical protein
MSDLEEILISLYASAINVSISWIWDGEIDVKLGDPLDGYKAESKVGTVTEVAECLRDQAVRHYPASSLGNSRRAEPPLAQRTAPKPARTEGKNGAEYEARRRSALVRLRGNEPNRTGCYGRSVNAPPSSPNIPVARFRSRPRPGQ